jgi:hypothetical protein
MIERWATISSGGTIDTSTPGQYLLSSTGGLARVRSQPLGIFDFTVEHKVVSGSGTLYWLGTQNLSNLFWRLKINTSGTTVEARYVDLSDAEVVMGTVTITAATFTAIRVRVRVGQIAVTITPSGGSPTTFTVDSNLTTRGRGTSRSYVVMTPDASSVSAFRNLSMTRDPADGYVDMKAPGDTLRSTRIEVGNVRRRTILGQTLLNVRRDIIPPAGTFTRYTLNAGAPLYNGLFIYENCWSSMLFREVGAINFERGLWLSVMERQQTGGWIPGFVGPDGSVNTAIVYAQPYACQNCYLMSNDGDTSWFSYTRLQDHLTYWETNRKSSRGLFIISEGREGWDGFISVNPSLSDPSPLNRYEWIGHSAIMYREYLAMAGIAAQKGLTSDHTTYLNKANALKTLIQTTAWDPTGPSGGWFFAYNTSTNAFHQRYQADAIYALYAGVATTAQAQVIRDRIMDPAHFYRPHGITSLDITDSSYVPHNVVLFQTNWNGAVWVPVQWLAAIGLMNYGYTADAKAIANKLEELYDVQAATADGIGEWQDPETGLGFGQTSFTGWSGQAGMLGYQVDTGYNPMAIVDTTTVASLAPTTDTIAPSVPTGLTSTFGHHSASLSWTDDPDVDSYKVYRSTDGVTYTLVATLNPVTDGTSYSDSGLTNGQAYYYRVTGTDDASNESGPATASGTPALPPGLPGAILTLTPAVYLRLGEAIGATTAADLSGNGRNGTATSVTFGEASLLTGDADTSAKFNGSTSQISIPSCPELTANWTIFCRFKKNANGVSQVIWDRFTNSTTARQLEIQVNSANKIEVDVPFVAVVLTGTTVITDTNPHTLMVTRSGNVWTIYLDGVSDGTVTSATTQQTGATAVVGRSPNLGTCMNGWIDEVAVWASALTSTDAVNLHTLATTLRGKLLMKRRRYVA